MRAIAARNRRSVWSDPATRGVLPPITTTQTQPQSGERVSAAKAWRDLERGIIK